MSIENLTAQEQKNLIHAAQLLDDLKRSRAGLDAMVTLLEAIAEIAGLILVEKKEHTALVRGDRTWLSIDSAPKTGDAFLAFGIHDDGVYRRDDVQRGVDVGDYWWAIILWDRWRTPQWVFAKDGAPVWSPPLLWQSLAVPAQYRGD